MKYDDSDSSSSDEEIKDTRKRSVWRRRSTLTQRITSRLWEFDELDPYQIFKVHNKKCLLLRVQVYNGCDISKGWWSELVYRPNPYLILDLRGTPNGKKITPVVKRSCSPEWNVCFQFLVDPNIMHSLYITLMDNGLIQDRTIGTEIFEIHKLKRGKEEDVNIEFKDGSKVSMVFCLVKSYKQDLRFSLSLPTEEINFVRKRRMEVFKGMKKFLGPESAPKELREVPVVAILNSGGGIRAVIASCGVFKALHEIGLLDCAMYVAGLSGSSWYLTYLYTHPNFPDDIGPGDLIPEIQEKITSDWKELLTLRNVFKYLHLLGIKVTEGQSISFADFYGHILGEMLLGEEYVEFSPYEVGLPKYGAFMRTENFGSKFYVGKIVKRYDELPFHYLIGVWGSAFSILFKRLIDEENQTMKLMHGGAQNETENEEENFQEDNEEEEKEEDFEYSQEDDDIELAEFINTLEKHKSILKKQSDNYGSGTFDIEEEFNESGTPDKFKPDLHKPSRSTNFLSKVIKPVKNIKFFTKCCKIRKKYHGNKAYQKKGKKSVRIEENWGSEEEDEIFLKDLEGSCSNLDENMDFNRKDSQDSDTSDISYENTDYKRRKTYYEDVRMSQKASEMSTESGFWHGVLERSINIKAIGGSRAGRAGIIFNPLRALSLINTYPISPTFGTFNDGDEDFQGTEEPIEAYAKELCLVDAGLAFNSPFPLLLRPQRAVDVFLSFDYSSRPADFHEAFGELVLAEKWAIKNNVTFPPIQELVQKYYDEPMREVYVFKHPDDPYCPILVHCIIFNGLFKEYKAPDIKRETSEEFKFADFKIFSDPNNPYSSYKYTYTQLEFERLCKLMEFNTLCGMKTFRKVLKNAVKRKKKLLTGQPLIHPSSKFIS